MKDRSLVPPGIALSLLLLVPIVAVGLTYLTVIATFDSLTAALLVIIVAPPLITGVATRIICWRTGVAESSALVIAPVVIAALGGFLVLWNL